MRHSETARELRDFDAYHAWADSAPTSRRVQAERCYAAVRAIVARRLAEGRDARSFITRAAELLDTIDGGR
jgi:hypothetical protein